MKRYIYNLEQAYFYIQKGVRPIDIPKIHERTKKVFFTFDDEETKNAYEQWCLLCEQHNNFYSK